MADANNFRLFLTPEYTGSDISYDDFDLKNASGGALRAAWVSSAEDHNQVITHVGFRQGTTTGTPASNSYKIGIYTIDGTGLPTATDIGGGSPTEVQFQPSSANDSKFIWVALTNSVTIARGTFFAIVLQNNADTSANGITVGWRAQNMGWGVFTNIPYGLTYAASAWTKSSQIWREYIFGYKSASKVYGFTMQSSGASATTSTSGHRVANKFKLPAGMGSTFAIKKIRGVFRYGVDTDTYTGGIWNAAGTLLQGGSIDSGHSRADAGAPVHIDIHFPDSSLAALNFGTAYYAGIQTSGQFISTQTATFNDANDQLAFPLGADAVYSTWNGSVWTDTATQRAFMNLVFDDITPGGGSGLPKLIGNNSLLG